MCNAEYCTWPCTQQVLKVMATICLGFVYSLMTTIFGVLAVQKLTGKGAAVVAPIATPSPPLPNARKSVETAVETATKPAPAKAFRDSRLPTAFVQVVHPLATRSLIV